MNQTDDAHRNNAHPSGWIQPLLQHPDRSDAERGTAHYQEALALAEPRGMRPLVAHCHLGLARRYRRTGRRQAQEHLSIAITMYRQMDMRFYLELAEAEKAALG